MAKPPYPFYDWTNGSTTHWVDCWKQHLTCSLLYAVDLLDEFVATDNRAGEEEARGFIDYIRKNQ